MRFPPGIDSDPPFPHVASLAFRILPFIQEAEALDIPPEL